MGANTIRIYGWNETADHSDFLDACYNNGVDPIYVLINRWINPTTNWLDTSAVNQIGNTFLSIDSRLGNHPAVIGLILGNEANIQNGNDEKPSFWNAMNTIAGRIKSQTPSRQISIAITDAIPSIAAFDDVLPNIDFWSIQTYRGVTLGNFFNQYSLASDKPMILSEFGMDNWDNTNSIAYPDNGQFIADTVSNLWLEIETNSSISAGGCVFEFSDEWWKGQGSPTIQDSGGFVQGGFPDSTSNEEWYGLFEISLTSGGGPNTLSPRASFGALQNLWLGESSSLSNISTRGRVGIENSIMIGGFVIEGSENMEVLIQGVGQELIGSPNLDATNTLSDPSIFLVNSAGEFIADNDNWQSDKSAEKLQAMGDSGSYQLSDGSSSAALLETLAPGSYTVLLLGVENREGISLIEIYQVPTDEESTSKLINISTRGDVKTGDNIMIGGFVIEGTANKRVLIQGVGQELIGSPNLDATNTLSNPSIFLVNSSGEFIADNDNWQDDDATTKSQAMIDAGSYFLADGSTSAALLENLTPGSYTVLLLGVDSKEGIALVEVYELD